MSAGGSAPRVPRTLSETLLGLLGGGMVLLAVVLLLMGGGPDDGAARPTVPALSLREPEEGAVLSGRFELIFDAEAELRPRPAGWGTGELHLHVRIDDQQFMPATGDIERLPTGGYRWTFAPLTPGDHRLQLFWSDDAHRPLAGGRSPVVRVEAR